MNTICPTCGESRTYKPSTVARLKSLVCRKCITKMQQESLVDVKCPKCGRVRTIPPYEVAKKVRRGHKSEGYCRSCPRVYDQMIPDTFEAGYLVGVVMGDGSLDRSVNKKGYVAFHVRLSVTSRAFAEKFRAIFHGLRGGRPVWFGTRESDKKANPAIGMPACHVKEWIVDAVDRGWYERLSPMKHARDFSRIRSAGREFKAGFLDGMVDSEGYVNSSLHYTRVAGKDMELLDVVAKCASELGYRAKIQGPYVKARGVAHVWIGHVLNKTCGV